jgi:hypothetical protein
MKAIRKAYRFFEICTLDWGAGTQWSSNWCGCPAGHRKLEKNRSCHKLDLIKG